MSKENKNEMDLGDNILGFVEKIQDRYYKNKSQRRMKDFIKKAKLLTEIESESFVLSVTEEGVKTSYLNAEGFRLACLEKDGQKTYSMAKDLALGEDLFATWSYDDKNEVKNLNVLKDTEFDLAIKTMKKAVDTIDTEKQKQDVLKRKSNKRKY